MDQRRARAHLTTSESHLDRQASSQSSLEHIGNAFESTSVERERVYLSIQARQKYPEGTFEPFLFVPNGPFGTWHEHLTYALARHMSIQMLESAKTIVFVMPENSKRSNYLFRRAKRVAPTGGDPTPQRKRLKRFYVRMLSLVERNGLCPINP